MIQPYFKQSYSDPCAYLQYLQSSIPLQQFAEKHSQLAQFFTIPSSEHYGCIENSSSLEAIFTEEISQTIQHILSSQPSLVPLYTTIQLLVAITLADKSHLPLLLEGDTVVKGEIVEVKDEFLKEVLKRCDSLEGHPCIYERKVVTIEIDGQKEQCYTYIFKQYTMLGAEIPSGNYKEEYNILFKR